MFDLNRDLKKTLAEFGLMVTLTVALAACSHSGMSPDTMDSEIANVQVEDTEAQATQTLGESTVTEENSVTGEAQTKNSRPVVRHHRSAKSKSHRKSIAKHFKPAKKIAEAKVEKTELDQQQLLAASAATVSSSIETPPTLPPSAELEVPSELPLSETTSSNWMYVVGIGILFGALAVAWRLRRRGPARRLILN